ncbi:MAG: glycosyltransferase family 2 protein [Christensenellaceae bacterium]|jgi:dolichol-phosphate mannosyltransferase|nr:glycosyltransferase family 2 protein [Christensenellaceae bacterium]
MQKTLSLVIPAYNEQAVIPESFAQMDAAMRATGCPYEIIYVDDGSGDDTWARLSALAAAHPQVRALRFSRNFGHQLAVTAGMDAAVGDAIIIIDIDLQDPPAVIAELVAAWERGADIAYGKRKKREGESLFKRFTAWCYYRLLGAMSAYPIPLDTGDFRLISRAVANDFLRMREHDRFLRGMSAWMGYNAVPVEYVRQERKAGSSKYTFKKMLRLAMAGIFGFSGRPLTAIGYVGAAVGILSAAGLLALAVGGASAPGWLWAFFTLALLLGVIMLAQGIQGAYLNRIYDEVRGRPLYIVRETAGAQAANKETIL